MDDFTYKVNVEGIVFHVREVIPKDFYLAQILRQQDRSLYELLLRLILNPECLDEATSRQTRAFMNWCGKNVLDSNILKVENWLEIAFHLCKQRWDSSVDWLELQPMSKILTMIDIVKKHAEDTEKANKKASRKK